jgi:hypothetical protein
MTSRRRKKAARRARTRTCREQALEAKIDRETTSREETTR